MRIIGLNLGHDSAVSFIENGIIKYAIEEEKLSRVKQEFGFPIHALNRFFKEFKIKKSEIDIIALTNEIPGGLRKNELKFRFTKSPVFKNLEYIDRIVSYFGVKSAEISEQENKKLVEALLRDYGFNNARIVYFNHHLGHAASAYYAAPIPCDLIITCDGHGGLDCLNYYVPHETGLTLLRSHSYKASIGSFYSMITKLLGFRATRHEGKITGLAAFGKPTILCDKFEELFRYNEEERLERFPFEQVEKHWIEYGLEKSLSLSQKINLKTSAGTVSLDYAIRAHILLKKLAEISQGFSKEDIAFACQAVSEKLLVNDLDKILRTFFKDRSVSIGLAGGVFSNVRCNQKMYEHPGVNNIFVQPAMGDSGLSLGNAILADIANRSKNAKDQNYGFKDAYYGPDFRNEVDEFVKKAQEDSSINIQKMKSPAKEVAKLIAENRIVGFCQGRMEWGPRALGNRSIILNTFDKKVNDSLNKRLDRTDFMPFAPSVLDYMAKEYFPAYKPEVPAANFMTVTYDTEQKYHELLQAVVHVDGTARPQIVSKSSNEYYYSVLEEFYKISNCGAVVNTSFNAHEEPIVSSPEVSLRALLNGRIDCLVIENYLITRSASQ